MDPASGSLDPEHNDHAAFTQAEVNQLASSPPTSSPRQARSPMNKNCINQSYQTPMVKKTPSKNTYTAARINTCSSRKGGNANGNMNDSFDVWYTPHETPSRRHKSKAKSPPKMGQLQRNDSRDFEDFAADILDESRSTVALLLPLLWACICFPTSIPSLHIICKHTCHEPRRERPLSPHNLSTRMRMLIIHECTRMNVINCR